MPRPEPWILAVAAAFSAVLAVVVVFQIAVALREWRMRRDALGSLKSDDRGARALQSPGSVVRTGADAEGGLLHVLGERVPQLWDLHHLLVQSGLKWTLEGFLARVAFVGMLLGLIALAALPEHGDREPSASCSARGSRTSTSAGRRSAACSSSRASCPTPST